MTSVLIDERVEQIGAISFARSMPQSTYRDRWESEAATNHVLSAIADPGSLSPTLESLTGKIAPIWSRFRTGMHAPTILDVGAGYGRIELYLAIERGLTCDTFCAVDISAGMLSRLLEYREMFAVFPGAEVVPVCASADDIPIADESVDVILSSVVFLHMGKSFVARAFAEMRRVLKPGGSFVIDNGFPNGLNPANWPGRLKPKRWRNPNALKYWRRGEVERLLRESGLQERVGTVNVEPATFAVLPKNLGPLRVPLARRVNSALGEPTMFPGFFGVAFSAYGPGMLDR